MAMTECPCKGSRPELLCPAGNMARLKSAVAYGADAVYLSAKQFGMRSAPGNFSLNELKSAVSYAHSHGVRVYLACNILMKDDDLEGLPTLLLRWDELGVNAYIAGDLGTVAIIRRTLPNAVIHASVQMGVSNAAAACVLYEQGVKRIILSRELSLIDIAAIRRVTPPQLELEAFVHGAMCVSFSGRCLLSDYMADRSAGRGDCAQPCRWNYALMEEKRPGQFYPVFEDDEGSYILNAHDLCMIEHIPQLFAAGVTSFKIEGRAKSDYYAAVTANAYRCVIDDWLAKGCQGDYHPASWMTDELYKISHRPYSTGFYLGKPHGSQQTDDGGYIRDYAVAGIAESWQAGMLTYRQKNKVFAGDCLEVIEPGVPPFYLRDCRLFDADGLPIPATPHPNMTVQVVCERPVSPGAFLRVAIAADTHA